MITVTRKNVSRIVPEEDVGKWIAKGYAPPSGWAPPADAKEDLIEDTGSEEVSPEPSWSEEELKKMTVLPMPLVMLSPEDEAEIAGIQLKLSGYAETTMARFVTGDVELNDEQWKLFCDTVEELGLSRMIEIWQKYI